MPDFLTYIIQIIIYTPDFLIDVIYSIIYTADFPLPVCLSEKPRPHPGDHTQETTPPQATPTETTPWHLLLQYTARSTCANPPVDGDGVFRWQTEGDAFQQELTYRNRTLVIQKEGTYFIYSKIYYNESPCGLFKHEVVRLSPRYNDPMTLMQNIRYRCLNTQRSDRTDRKETGNSFLSGAFELKTGDLIYVKVNNKSLVLSGMHDNFFGAFMI
ncbi:tumor necrosis factor ligand superfamily member 10-like [Chanos chanos]|uniref:Tumor necrosis factor ligand superfamily member 10-like n=1 Tax=Chanos chanos TaxID=29144 RepID=A0A6J2VVZ3_CHACN|nr:tumor necrosis factor ligand superfamily member 10-like [Chanos chanos]